MKGGPEADMTRRNILIIVVSLTSILALATGVTLALLTSISGPVENTFTLGEISISLDETTGNTYDMIPGTTVAKDPKVTVKRGSEDCWLFIKLDKSTGIDSYLSYGIDEGWTVYDGDDGIYYRKLDYTAHDTAYPILKDDCFTVRDSLTEEMMSAIASKPTMAFSAYAVQSYGVEDASEAWALIEENFRSNV